MKPRKLQHRILVERIEHEASMRRASDKFERQMRRTHERFIAREFAEYRRTTDEHLERLNNADRTAAEIALEVKTRAREVELSTVTKEVYEADKATAAARLDAERENARLQATNAALSSSNRQGREDGRNAVIGLSRNVVLFVLAVAGGVIAILRFVLPPSGGPPGS